MKFLFITVVLFSLLTSVHGSEQQRIAEEKARIADAKRKLEAEKVRIAEEKARFEKEKQLLADHKAIRETVIAHRSAVLTADLEKMLSISSKNYSETAWNGKKRTYDDLLKMVKYYSLMRSSDELEVVMENALLIQGESISDQLREKAASIKKTAQARQTIDAIRSAFDRIIASSSRSIRFITVSNIRISGDRAVAVSEISEPGEPQTFPVTYELICHRGKWLVLSVR